MMKHVAVSATAVFCVAGLLFTGRLTLTGVLFPRYAAWHEPHCGLSFPGAADGTHPYVWFENYFVARQARAAEWLNAHAAQDATVASTPAGSIAYHTRLRVIDMLGLNDVHIAHTKGAFGGTPGKGRAGHEKGDGAYVLRRAPEFILMGNVAVLPFPLTHESMPDKIRLKSEHELWQNPQFHADYELKTVRLDDSGPFQYFSFYQRKSPAASVE
jgi:hypothetical protein